MNLLAQRFSSSVHRDDEECAVSASSGPVELAGHDVEETLAVAAIEESSIAWSGSVTNPSLYIDCADQARASSGPSFA